MEKQVGEILFRAEGMCKYFGPTVALDHVDLSVRRGEIMGLIGENGSGKSTISSIASGMQPANAGQMFFKGQPHKPATMIEGLAAGVGMIVQESGVVTGISVAENIFLGDERKFRKGLIVNRKKMNQEAARALERIGFTDVPPCSAYDESGYSATQAGGGCQGHVCRA